MTLSSHLGGGPATGRRDDGGGGGGDGGHDGHLSPVRSRAPRNWGASVVSDQVAGF